MKSFLIHVLFIKILFLSILGGSFIVKKLKIDHLNILAKNNYIYFNPFSDQSIIDFKLEKDKTEISIIGTSRVSGIEKEMFANKSVYNYSMIVNSLNDIYKLIKKLTINKNDTIILGLDQWNFNKNYVNRNFNKFKKNYLNFPFIFFDEINLIDSILLVGTKAKENFSGFRNDGSYFHGKRFIVSDNLLEDFNFKDTFNRIEKGNNRFEYGSEPDQIQLRLLEEILKYCSDSKINVIAFFPPFSPSVNQKMQSKNYDYIKKSSLEIKKIFNSYSFIFEDFTQLDFYGDEYYLDGFHCNRNVYYKILKELNIKINKDFDDTFEIKNDEIYALKEYFNY